MNVFLWLDFSYSRHLFEYLDGQKFKISVPKGPIGGKVKELNDNLTPLVDFQPIPTNVPQVPSDLFKEACNRQRLHELLISISNGRGAVHPKFETNRYPPVGGLRWLTCGERVGGVFIREPNPSQELKILMAFASQAYAPAHMETFLNPGFENSSWHYLWYIQRAKVCILQ